MKVNKEIKSFKDLMDSACDESINESYASYTGTNMLGTVRGTSNNKYSPATVMSAPPIKTQNQAVDIGQPDNEMLAPKQLLYPFEGIFSELVEVYARLRSIKTVLEDSKKLATLSDEKKKAVASSSSDLELSIKTLEEVIKKIEEVTV